MGDELSFSADVNGWSVYKNLCEQYFEPIEKIIRTKLSPTTLNDQRSLKGAEEVINSVILEATRMLKRVVPGGEIYWDDRVHEPPAYKSFPVVIIDPVDGAKELKRGGTEVSSTLLVRTRDGAQLSIISYPFGRERIIDINGKVYRLPQNFDFKYGNLDDYRLQKRENKRDVSELYIAERYDNFTDDLRKRLDELRPLTIRSMKRPFGSSAKIMTSVATGPFDIFIRNNPPRFCDYEAPRKIITDLEGVFTDLDGKDPDGVNDMNGIIAASTKENYKLFVDFLTK